MYISAEPCRLAGQGAGAVSPQRTVCRREGLQKNASASVFLAVARYIDYSGLLPLVAAYKLDTTMSFCGESSAFLAVHTTAAFPVAEQTQGQSISKNAGRGAAAVAKSTHALSGEAYSTTRALITQEPPLLWGKFLFFNCLTYIDFIYCLDFLTTKLLSAGWAPTVIYSPVLHVIPGAGAKPSRRRSRRTCCLAAREAPRGTRPRLRPAGTPAVPPPASWYGTSGGCCAGKKQLFTENKTNLEKIIACKYAYTPYSPRFE